MTKLPTAEETLTPTKMKAPTLPTARDLIAKIIPNQANFEHCGQYRTINGSLLIDIEKAIESHTQAHTEGLRERVKELEAELNDVKFRFKTAIQGLRSANEIIKKLNNEA